MCIDYVDSWNDGISAHALLPSVLRVGETLAYNCTDSSGNSAVDYRQLVLDDSTPPELNLVDTEAMNLEMDIDWHNPDKESIIKPLLEKNTGYHVTDCCDAEVQCTLSLHREDCGGAHIATIADHEVDNAAAFIQTLDLQENAGIIGLRYECSDSSHNR